MIRNEFQFCDKKRAPSPGDSNDFIYELITARSNYGTEPPLDSVATPAANLPPAIVICATKNYFYCRAMREKRELLNRIRKRFHILFVRLTISSCTSAPLPRSSVTIVAGRAMKLIFLKYFHFHSTQIIYAEFIGNSVCWLLWPLALNLYALRFVRCCVTWTRTKARNDFN